MASLAIPTISQQNSVAVRPKFSAVYPSSLPKSRRFCLGIRAEVMATEKMGIKIVKNPPESKLQELGVRNWPKWGCPPSKFPWTYDAKETCYLLEGKVKVFPDGHKEFVEFGGGDLVEFPKGMKCTWEVSQAVDKHYKPLVADSVADTYDR